MEDVMKISSTIAFAACLLTVSLTSAASTTPQAAPDGPDEARAAAAATAVVEEPRQICRMEKQTGSQRATRVCRSAEQMQRDRNDAGGLVGSRGTPPPPRER